MSDVKGPLFICADGFREEVETGIDDRKARTAALRSRIRHLLDRRAARRAETQPEPRYDEIYWAGVAALDNLDRGSDDSEEKD